MLKQSLCIDYLGHRPYNITISCGLHTRVFCGCRSRLRLMFTAPPGPGAGYQITTLDIQKLQEPSNVLLS